jgi:hypothetical protein
MDRNAALFFFKPTKRNAAMIQLILTLFGKISWLKVNMNKSEVLVTEDMDTIAASLALQLKCRVGTFPLKYLGLQLTEKN